MPIRHWCNTMSPFCILFVAFFVSGILDVMQPERQDIRCRVSTLREWEWEDEKNRWWTEGWRKWIERDGLDISSNIYWTLVAEMEFHHIPQQLMHKTKTAYKYTAVQIWWNDLVLANQIIDLPNIQIYNHFFCQIDFSFFQLWHFCFHLDTHVLLCIVSDNEFIYVSP